jgi:hypothetical protein
MPSSAKIGERKQKRKWNPKMLTKMVFTPDTLTMRIKRQKMGFLFGAKMCANAVHLTAAGSMAVWNAASKTHRQQKGGLVDSARGSQMRMQNVKQEGSKSVQLSYTYFSVEQTGNDNVKI